MGRQILLGLFASVMLTKTIGLQSLLIKYVQSYTVGMFIFNFLIPKIRNKKWENSKYTQDLRMSKTWFLV